MPAVTRDGTIDVNRDLERWSRGVLYWQVESSSRRLVELAPWRGGEVWVVVLGRLTLVVIHDRNMTYPIPYTTVSAILSLSSTIAFTGGVTA